jgi:hypothetical protein
MFYDQVNKVTNYYMVIKEKIEGKEKRNIVFTSSKYQIQALLKQIKFSCLKW